VVPDNGWLLWQFTHPIEVKDIKVTGLLGFWRWAHGWAHGRGFERVSGNVMTNVRLVLDKVSNQPVSWLRADCDGGANNASKASSASCQARISCLIVSRSTGFHVVASRVLREKEDGSGSAVIGNDTGANNVSRASIASCQAKISCLIVARSPGCCYSPEELT